MRRLRSSTWCLGAACGACLGGWPPVSTVHAQIAAEYGSVVDSYKTTKIAEGIDAFLAPDSKTPFVSGNSLAVIGRDGVLVVDSGHVPALARRMIGDIKRLTDKPVRFIVNTH